MKNSRQVVRERLGKVIWLAKDRKTGIFLSPDRGLVEYSSVTDTFLPVDYADPRLAGRELPQTSERHVIFGDAFWLLELLEQYALGAVPDAALHARF